MEIRLHIAVTNSSGAVYLRLLVHYVIAVLFPNSAVRNDHGFNHQRPSNHRGTPVQVQHQDLITNTLSKCIIAGSQKYSHRTYHGIFSLRHMTKTGLILPSNPQPHPHSADLTIVLFALSAGCNLPPHGVRMSSISRYLWSLLLILLVTFLVAVQKCLDVAAGPLHARPLMPETMPTFGI